MSKVGYVTPSRPINGGIVGDPILGYLDPDLSIHYTIFKNRLKSLNNGDARL